MSARPPHLSPLARHVRDTELLAPGSAVVAAVSGGADSLGLLVILDELRRAGLLKLSAAHVHHGLRDVEADADAAHVALTCERLGIPFFLRRRDTLETRRRRRRGLEEAARAVRREALEDVRVETSSDAIVLAHTLDDQAETVLLRLLRGTGPEGLGGMRPVTGRFVRPLLDVRREELRRHVLRAGLTWRSDPSNWGGASARSLLRPVMTRFEDCLNLRASEHVARAARLAGEESEWLDERAAEAGLALVAQPEPGRPLRLRAGADGLGGLPHVLARRLVRSLLRRARPGAPPPSEDAVARVLRLGSAAFTGVREVHLAGLVVRRSGSELLLGSPAAPRTPEQPVPVAVPGSLRWGSLGTLEAREEAAPADPLGLLRASGEVALLDRDTIPGDLAARAPRPDDRFRPAGSTSERRLRGFLRDRGVPAADRDHVLVICRSDRQDAVACVPGHGVAHEHRLTPATRRLLLLEWRPALVGATR